MERVEEIASSEIVGAAASEDETSLEINSQPSVTRSLPRWLLPSFVLHMALALVVTVGGLRVVESMNAISMDMRATGSEVETLTKRAAEHTAQTESLKREVGNLREFLHARSNEDVIFLKTVILKPAIDPELARTIAKNVHHYSELYGRDADLVLAMIAVESRFDPKVVSPMGAIGLMQVMPQWKKVLGLTGDLADPEVSIKTGLQILGFYTEMYKDLDMSLTAYNRGPGQVDSALMRGQDPTNKYAPRVLEQYQRLKRLTVSTQAEETVNERP